MKFGLFLLCLFLLTAPSRAGAIEGYGVQVKEGRTTDEELLQIKRAGLDYVRFVMPWYEIERGKNRYVWGAFDSFVVRLRKAGLKAVVVLGGGHPLHTERLEAPEGNIDHDDYVYAAPKDASEVTAFARYAARTVEHYGTRDIIWEIWNEPDSDRFWAPEAKVEDYIALADATCRAIRKTSPEARIVGPGMADMPGRFGHLLPGFLGKILQSPVSSCLNAVSVHPYRDGAKPPETVTAAYEKLRAYIAAFTPEGQTPLPVYATEWGFTTTDVSPSEQADFLLRSFLLNSLNNVPVSIWYEWRDAREGADDPEAHFGLLDLGKGEKESYKALASFLPPIKGATIEQRLNLGGSDAYVLRLRRKNGTGALVFWSSAAEPDGQLKLRGGVFGDGRVWPLTSRPQMIELGNQNPALDLVQKEPMS